ncbi:MAG: polyprenyl synthetase family protein [Acuticoccus sp.]
MRYSLFPGGARSRPTLSVTVAIACGDDRPLLTDGCAAALEFLHCASLVHDDLPCFDDAATRRSKPSVHAAYGEAMAVLVGDGLIVMAFQTLGDVAQEAGQRLGPLLACLADAVGAPNGLVAGQAMESEPACDTDAYHAAKTGALFEAAAVGGALAAGVSDTEPWRALGARLGAAYQIADDLRDRFGSTHEIGKPIGRDAALERPNSIDAYGLDGSVALLRRQIADATDAVPDLAEANLLRRFIADQAERIMPSHPAPAAQ